MITREYLDARAQYPRQSDVPNLIAALRRVLDLRDGCAPYADFVDIDDLDAALAGTQTDDGAVSTDLASGEALPAPSSPDRIEAVAQAILDGIPWESLHHQATATVAALDAYDRENPSPALADALAEADQLRAALDTQMEVNGKALADLADLREREEKLALMSMQTIHEADS